MKRNFKDSFNNRIILYTVISLLISVAAVILLRILIVNFGLYLSHKGYRGQFVDRRGINPVFLATCLYIAGGLSFIISFLLLLRSFVKYINEINDGMNQLAEGNLDYVIPVRGNNEFSNIAENLNEMALTLKTSIENERNSEQTKKELITNVAHDLKTPLTSVLGYLNILQVKKDELDEETRDRYVDVAYRKAKHLQQLINDFFSLTKIENGGMPVNKTRLDLVKLLEQLLDEFYPQFEENGLTCELIKDSMSLQIDADGALMARLFENLVGNAVKYGKEGKLIKVQVGDDSGWAVVSVTNFGRIISEEDLNKVFNKFYRAEQSRPTNTGGTGLGLAIAKDIVEMHDGKIKAESSLKGTVFTVRLPLIKES